MVMEEMGLSAVDVQYGSFDRGWAGDVPRIRFSAGKMKSLTAGRHSAIPRRPWRAAIRGMLANFRQGLVAS